MNQIVLLVVAFALIVLLIIGSLALVATPAHGAGRPRACVGVVVRVINPGVDVARQANGKLCTRPSVTSVRKVRR
jgi:hypothetical protein